MNFLLRRETYLTVYFVFFVLILISRFYDQLTVGFTKDSWEMTEWLINYQGGFVRRGLPGEILLNLYNYFNIHPYYVIIGVSSLSYLLVIVFIVRAFVKKGYSIWVLPFVFFLGNPIINNFWLRKDSLLLLLFILIIYLIAKRPKFYLIYINLVFIIGLLIHESILFFTFPILFLLLTGYYKKREESANKLLKAVTLSILSIFPTLVCLFLIILNKGNMEMSEAIWYSWDHVEFPFHQLYPDGRMYPEMEIPAAIDGLSWTAQTAFEKLGWYLDYFSYNIYAPFLLMISIFSVYYVLSNIHRLGDCIFAVKPKKNNGIGISYILIFQFCTLLPLYVIAVDYGRWIYFWVVSSFVIDYFIPRLNILGIAPRIYIKCVDFFNLTIRYAIGNSKGTIMILTLCIGFSYVYSDLISTFITSSAYITMSKFSNLFVRFFLFLESLI